MSDLIPFTFDTHQIRIRIDDDGKPWWVINDVCDVLGITEHRVAARRLRAQEKGGYRIPTPGGQQEVLFVNESGLYRLIFRSDKPDAQRFQDWVFGEVLPAIRQRGTYTASPSSSAVDQFPELRAIVELAESTAQARLIAEEARKDAAQANANATQANANATQANANALRAIDTQQFLTIAEYVYINKLQRQLPESKYKAASDHLHVYCMEHIAPFRRIHVGGKRWPQEYAFHINVYSEAFDPWLKRQNGQGTIHIVGQ